MKKLTLGLILLVILISSNLFAEDLKGKFSISPYVGLGFPIGDFADDDWSTNEDAAYRAMGYKFGLSFDYYFSKNFAGGLNFKYISFPSKDYDVLDEPDQDDKLKMTLIGVYGKLIFVPEGDVRPYGKVGFGILNSSISDFPAIDWQSGVYYVTDVELDSKYYLQFGAGISFFVSPNVSLFGELTIDNLRMDGAKMEFTDIPGAEDGEIEVNHNAVDFIAGINIWFGGAK